MPFSSWLCVTSLFRRFFNLFQILPCRGKIALGEIYRGASGKEGYCPPQTALVRDLMRGLINACSAQEKTSVYESCGEILSAQLSTMRPIL
jgi:hypothetical protein